MSAALARIAVRASVRTTFQAAPRRNFSLGRVFRGLANGMEAHPHARDPVGQTAQAGDYGKYLKNAGKVFLVYVPGFTIVLGWPAAARWAMEGRM
ncbi:hypothetical protein GQ53DRAFT_822018 [Thozetella sp. PMI_491]|nr:hypothetical protein GQ53DRAFT_822018 [Thozetella sp. PMI_491]